MNKYTVIYTWSDQWQYRVGFARMKAVSPEQARVMLQEKYGSGKIEIFAIFDGYPADHSGQHGPKVNPKL